MAIKMRSMCVAYHKAGINYKIYVWLCVCPDLIQTSNLASECCVSIHF
jgi:hypothetical protein